MRGLRNSIAKSCTKHRSLAQTQNYMYPEPALSKNNEFRGSETSLSTSLLTYCETFDGNFTHGSKSYYSQTALVDIWLRALSYALDRQKWKESKLVDLNTPGVLEIPSSLFAKSARGRIESGAIDALAHRICEFALHAHGEVLQRRMAATILEYVIRREPQDKAYAPSYCAAAAEFALHTFRTGLVCYLCKVDPQNAFRMVCIPFDPIVSVSTI